MALSGGCRCGACRYTLAGERIPATYACHCLTCQTMSGASFALQAPVAEARLSVEGDLASWRHEDQRGHETVQRFCAGCMTRLYSTNSGRPGMALLRAGTLDRSDEVAPSVHMWTKRKQRWIGLPDTAETYDEAVPEERAWAIFAPNFM